MRNAETLVMMASFGVPPTQNTAPVLDYRCMFTSDLRRKQKRWQDGHLKFHTFNKRVMVYDERNNFVGDTHRREEQLEEGEELELDRRGILVEVGEFQGQKDQDLTELVGERRKDREERVAGSFMRDYGNPRGTEALRPKPLNEMLTPTGHYGRAMIPNISPFEEKQRMAGQPVDEYGRPAKKRKQTEDVPSKSGYAQSLMGTTLSLTSSKPPSTATIRYEPLKLKATLPSKNNTSIDLTADSDGDEDTVRRENRRQEEKSRNIQASRKRSPSAKRGYASSLIGAALSLSRPASFSSRQNIGSLLVNKAASRPLAVRMSDLDEELPSVAEDDSSMDIFCSIGSPTPPKNLVRLDKDKTLNRQSLQDIFDSRSSTPTRGEEGPAKINKISKPESSSNTRSSPPTRTERLRETSNSSKSKNIHSSSSPIAQSRPNLTEVLSSKQRAVKDSSAVEQTPNGPRSSLRIKSRPPRNKMVMIMDRSSSRPSSRTALPNVSSRHKSNLQSRKRLDTALNEVVPSQAAVELDDFPRKYEKIQARLKGQIPKVDIDGFSSSHLDSAIDHHTIDLPLSRENDPRDRESHPKSHRSNQEGPTPASNISSRAYTLSEINNSSLRKTNTRKGTPGSDRARGLASDLEESSKAQVTQERLPHVPVREARCQAPENRSLMERGDLSAPQQPKKLVSLGMNIQKRQASEEPGSWPIAILPNGQPDPSEPAMKASLKASPVELQMATSEAQHQNNDSAIEKRKLESMPPPEKERLVNPATRGKSLQSIAANTADLLIPASNIMAPPAAVRNISRVNETNSRNAVVARCIDVREESRGGPWSRESFDLFGSWKPHERDAGASVASS